MSSPTVPSRSGGLSLPAQGILWMLLSTLVFSLMNVTIRESAKYMHPYEVVFFRNLTALLFMLPWLLRAGVGVLRTPRHRLYFTRALTGAIAMFTWFWGMVHMPLGNAQALSFTQPMFATLLAALVLREDVRIRRWTATILGFIGVLVIVQPGGRPVGLPEAAVLASAFFGAISTIQVKKLAATESTSAMVFFLALYITPMALPPALFVWTWPPWEGWVWVFAMGGVGTIGHLCVVRAFHLAEASALLPFDYLRLVLAAFWGWALYAEVLGLNFWLGSAIIAGSAIYIAHREAAIRRRDQSRTAIGLAGATPKSQT